MIRDKKEDQEWVDRAAEVLRRVRQTRDDEGLYETLVGILTAAISILEVVLPDDRKEDFDD